MRVGAFLHQKTPVFVVLFLVVFLIAIQAFGAEAPEVEWERIFNGVRVVVSSRPLMEATSSQDIPSLLVPDAGFLLALTIEIRSFV